MKRVTECLARRLPEVPVTSLEPLGEGEFCEAFLLNGAWVVRRARHGRAADALVREACLMPRVADRLPVPVPLPRVVSMLETDGMVLAVHPRIEGDALIRERWLGMLPESRRRTATGLGAFLRALHEIDPVDVERCGLVALHGGEPFDDLARRAENANGVLPARLRDAVATTLRRRTPWNLGWSGTCVLLNADVSPEHVLCDGSRITGIIDWGDAALGDPAREFIFLYEDWGDDFLALALEGYGAAGDEGFLARIRLHYLADQLSWVLDASDPDAAEIGVPGLVRALRDLGSEDVRVP